LQSAFGNPRAAQIGGEAAPLGSMPLQSARDGGALS
jgi:hypothetical protein